MKIKKSWPFWLIVCILFLLVGLSRSQYLTYQMKAETARLKFELSTKAKEEVSAPAPEGEQKRSKSKASATPPPPPPAPAPVKESTDIMGWVLKAGAGLSGLKTLLDIVDKFRKRAK